MDATEHRGERRGGSGSRRREHGCHRYEAPVRKAYGVECRCVADQFHHRGTLDGDAAGGEGVELSGFRLELPLCEIGGRSPIGNEHGLMRRHRMCRDHPEWQVAHLVSVTVWTMEYGFSPAVAHPANRRQFV